MFAESMEQKIENNEKKIAVLKMRLERYEKGLQEFFENVNVTPRELTDYLQTAANFEPEVWAHLEAFRAELDEKLQKELQNIRNPAKTSQTYAERKDIRQHWLYVK